jgi:predicted PolB exonuclease-like 3'-5' exonuclease
VDEKILAFDIETVPDGEAARRVYGFDPAMSDADVLEAVLQLRRQESEGREFLPLPLHRVVAIAVVYRTPQRIFSGALGELGTSEEDLVRKFFAAVDGECPQLVSWNGTGFDLPVLHYRALRYGVASPTYWETGDRRADFRYRNYHARHLSSRHTDLMDALAGGGGYGRAGARGRLDTVARLVGLPGKIGGSGEEILERVEAGRLAEVREYCEGDALNTYLLYLRYLYVRGLLDAEETRREGARVRAWLEEHPTDLRRAFLERWDRALWDRLGGESAS